MFESIIGICVTLLFLLFVFCYVLRSIYLDYHAEMHGIPLWGKVINSCVYNRPSPNYSVIEYVVGDSTYVLHLASMSPIRQGDSLIVYYDSTQYANAFVPKRNPQDIETAFFKFDMRLTSLHREEQYQDYQKQLMIRRKAHRERKHWYDRLCKDD